MKKIFGMLWGVFMGLYPALAAEKFDILPDLPESLSNAAQASSVSTIDNTNTLVSQSVGTEPNLFISAFFSMIFVILLIYASVIIMAKLNKFNAGTLKKQMGDSASKPSVISTTALGGNKTLHVVELDGKRMLIGASNNSIHLLKDLGTYPPCEIEEGEFSKIEIPNIRIPKIEIPKIEIPGFTKVISKVQKQKEENTEEETISPENNNSEETQKDDNFEISDIYVEEGPDGIIDKLFATNIEQTEEKSDEIEHKVDPEEFSLYKKYLNN